MEAAASALAIVQACFATAKGLRSLVEKYRNAATTITAIHAEMTAAAASMQLLHHILQETQSPISMRVRFDAVPELEQNFAVAVASFEMVLACLDSEIERLLHGFGSGGYPGKRVRAKLLWKEESMRELLQTLRGQHYAIFSIVQCFQMQGIADVSSGVERLRDAVISTQNGVENILRIPPLRHIQAVCADRGSPTMAMHLISSETQDASVRFVNKPEMELTKSEERIVKAYSQFQSVLSMRSSSSLHSNLSLPSTVVQIWDSQRANSSTPVPLPSCPMGDVSFQNTTLPFAAYNRVEDVGLVESQSPLTWTETWIEKQDAHIDVEEAETVPAEEDTPNHEEASKSSSSTAIAAPDLSTFLQNIHSFVPGMLLNPPAWDIAAFEPDSCSLSDGEVDIQALQQSGKEIQGVYRSIASTSGTAMAHLDGGSMGGHELQMTQPRLRAAETSLAMDDEREDAEGSLFTVISSEASAHRRTSLLTVTEKCSPRSRRNLSIALSPEDFMEVVA